MMGLLIFLGIFVILIVWASIFAIRLCVTSMLLNELGQKLLTLNAKSKNFRGFEATLCNTLSLKNQP